MGLHNKAKESRFKINEGKNFFINLHKGLLLMQRYDKSPAELLCITETKQSYQKRGECITDL